MVADGGVHLLLVDDLDLGGGAAQDSFLLLLGQLVRHHLYRFHPFVPVTVATDIQSFDQFHNVYDRAVRVLVRHFGRETKRKERGGRNDRYVDAWNRSPLFRCVHVKGSLDHSGPLQASDDEGVGLRPLRLHQLTL